MKDKNKTVNIKNPKKRNEYIYGTVDANDGIIEVTYDTAKRGFEFRNLVHGTLRHTISYIGESGKDKIVSSSLCLDQIGRFDLRGVLKINYDFLYAIDTNNKTINGEKLSIAVSYFVPQKLEYYDKEIPLLPYLVFEINDVKANINPETVAWYILITELAQKHNLSKEKVAIVVDSELGKLPEINNRIIPYYGANYLPQNIHLIYASSERGNELPNMMMSFCDRMSSKCLTYFFDNSITLNDKKNGDDNFRGYRYLRFKK